jgi:hypothetical protein
MTARLEFRQVLKIAIYSLLLVNFILYIIDDVRIASYTMRNGGSLLEWTRAFATTIDISAWLILLFLFELETFLLSDQTLSRPMFIRLMYAVRIFCYVFLVHSVYAFSVIYIDLLQVNLIPDISNLCELVPMDLSFVRNLAYTEIDLENCLTLSSGEIFYFTEPALVVSDISGLRLEKNLALVDILEVLVWLLILMTIEIMVWLQDQSITRGSLVSFIKGAKYILYGSLWSMAAYWAYLGHYYFAWDEALWIIGFISIEMNVSDWKREIEKNTKS